MTQDLAAAYAAALDLVLRRSHLMDPDSLAPLAADAAALLGAGTCRLWLVDYEQVTLVPLMRPGEEQRDVLSVDGSIAGRCFRNVDSLDLEADAEHRRLWLPLLDGVERLGVVEVTVATTEPLPADLRHAFEQLAHLLAELLVSNDAHTDHYEWTRRRQGMALAAEMQHSLLPPLTFGTSKVIISGLLAPAYEVGGDAFDYSLNGNVCHVAVFDAVGHGLQASLLAALAVSAYRNSRVAGLDLPDIARSIDEAIEAMFGGERFVTGLIGQLDVDTGVFRWVNAGHPAAMLLRGGQVVKELQGEPALPLGLQGLTGEGEAAVVSTESLQPGDRLLLLTDGVDEARDADGSFFGRTRLAEFAAREAASGLATPEVMRRLQQAVLRYQTGKLQDDATTLFVHWLTGESAQLTP